MQSKDQAGVFESLLDAHAKGKKNHTVLKHTSGAHIQDHVGKQHTVDSLEFVTRTEVKGIECLLAQQ